MTHSILLALLSGTLYVFSFAPWDQAWLQCFVFIPLFFASDKLPDKRNSLSFLFLIGMLASIVICVGGFYWMIHATQQYGGLPFSAALGVFFLFCATGQLQIPLFLVLRNLYSRTRSSTQRPIASALLLGLTYSGIESIYPKLFLDTAGHAFYHSPLVRQAADIGGPFFLTTLVVLINELFYLFLKKRNSKNLLAGLTILGLIFAYGLMRVNQYRLAVTSKPDTPVLNLAMIQANIGDYLKVAAETGAIEATDQVMNQYLNLSNRALLSDPKPDLLVWPETAYPAIFRKAKSDLEQRLQLRLDNFLTSFPGTLAFGGYDSDESRLEYNSLFFHHSPSNKTEIYHKSILLMFGETLPFSDTFPSMKEWFPTMGFFGRGPGPELKSVFSSQGTIFKIAPSICYEGLFTDHSVNGALLGADALLNITNDSWFGPHGEPYLHLALTQFRSIETRLPLLRATNTGITVSIDPLGETLGKTGIMREEVLHTQITHRIMDIPPYLMISRIFGPNWYVRFCQIILVIMVAFVMRTSSGLPIFRR